MCHRVIRPDAEPAIASDLRLLANAHHFPRLRSDRKWAKK
jgi:hypothetical protein